MNDDTSAPAAGARETHTEAVVVYRAITRSGDGPETVLLTDPRAFCARHKAELTSSGICSECEFEAGIAAINRANQRAELGRRQALETDRRRRSRTMLGLTIVWCVACAIAAATRLLEYLWP